MKTIDPVCKMEVDKDTELQSVYNGTTYYFCSKGCLEAFTKSPKKYVNDKTEHHH